MESVEKEMETDARVSFLSGGACRESGGPFDCVSRLRRAL